MRENQEKEIIEQFAKLFECDPPQTYSSIDEIPGRVSGIYILYDRDGIKYIGQSKRSIRRRLVQHRTTSHFSLNDLTGIVIIIVPYGRNRRDILEAALIWKLNPRFNLQWKRGG